jgi:hypothetical protein
VGGSGWGAWRGNSRLGEPLCLSCFTHYPPLGQAETEQPLFLCQELVFLAPHGCFPILTTLCKGPRPPQLPWAVAWGWGRQREGGGHFRCLAQCSYTQKLMWSLQERGLLPDGHSVHSG